MPVFTKLLSGFACAAVLASPILALSASPAAEPAVGPSPAAVAGAFDLALNSESVQRFRDRIAAEAAAAAAKVKDVAG